MLSNLCEQSEVGPILPANPERGRLIGWWNRPYDCGVAVVLRSAGTTRWNSTRNFRITVSGMDNGTTMTSTNLTFPAIQKASKSSGWLLTMLILSLCLHAGLHAGLPGLFADDDPAAKALEEIQGRWTRKVKSGNQVVTITKEHTDNKTVVTAISSTGEVLHQHTSEDKVEVLGRTKVLTYWNRTVLVGPEKGKVATEKRSYIFRIHQGKFVEAHGLLEGDEDPPVVIVWERPAGGETN